MLNDALIDLQHAQVSKVYGKYAGKVIDNQDPLNLGRLQVSCAAVLGDAKVWARPCVPYAGPGVGMFFLPPKGAGVWVEFEGGVPGRPIWVGCYWNSGELPADASTPDTKLIITDTASLKIDDQQGEVKLSNHNEASTTWAQDIKAEAGNATHTVGAAGVVSEASPGKVEVGASGVSINSGAFTVS
ncbi:phage baseplate assembly protein V [Paucibacter sp. APW11]|uniref:Phage baseplate assembly protein V n=1 Tax=Roseateles aquae TaxID=3077235 RepID=A0ABU3PBI9_9BURK|nr:phage baseplate assembly protein V [Paucibacter sp. APW11]MDT8999146.1 phage baseplate assembly protein V [Paucibacter sp. APW11]